MTLEADVTTETIVRGAIRALVAERAGERHPGPIADGARLEADLGLHSLERVELAGRLRDASIAVEPAAIVGAESVADIVALAQGRAAARSPSEDVRFPDDPIWHPADTPPRSRLFTAWIGALVAGVSATGRLRLLGRRGAPARSWLRAAARWLVRQSGCPLEVTGLDLIRAATPCVIVANHESYVDTVVLLATVPVDAKFVANEGLPRTPLLGPAVAAAEHLVVNRAAAADPLRAVEAMAATLEGGVSVIVYPEGTIAPGPALLPFRLGAFAAAVASGRPVVPVALSGTRRMLPFDTWLLAKTTLGVRVLPPIHPQGEDWTAVVRLAAQATDAIRAAIGR